MSVYFTLFFIFISITLLITGIVKGLPFTGNEQYYIPFIILVCLVAGVLLYEKFFVNKKKEEEDEELDPTKTHLKTYKFRIRGISHLPESSRQIVFNLQPGDILYLRRETWNEFDSNAMLVLKGNTKIGYIESPLNYDVLSTIIGNPMYQCRFIEKVKSENGYNDYYCQVVAYSKNENDPLPEGFTDPLKNNLLLDPQIDFEKGRDNYEFFCTPCEWICWDWSMYGCHSREEVENNRMLNEEFEEDRYHMGDFLRDLYEKRIENNDDLKDFMKETKKARVIAGNTNLRKMINKYIKEHNIPI